MITVTPQGNVYLCKTPLESDYKHQLTFANVTAQRNYFTGSTVLKHTCTDFTYIKKDNQIIVDFPIDTIIDCNYLYYQNTGFANKYYYAFITNMEYVNENATRITFEVDVFQTYMFNIVYKRSFVEREHVNDDTIGKHTIPEQLEHGDYTINKEVIYNLGSAGLAGYIIIGLSNLVEGFPTPSSSQYNGVFSGLTYYVLENATKATAFIKALMEAWEYDANNSIYCLFIAPKEYFGTNDITWQSGSIGPNTVEFGLITSSSAVKRMDNGNLTVSINTKLDNYTPHNNKLFTWPFNYILCSNNSGQAVDYRYEDFETPASPSFAVTGALSIGMSIRVDPLRYKIGDPDLILDNRKLRSYGLTCGKFPTCSWNSDSFTNWITANAVNLIGQTAGNVATLGFAVATGNLEGGIASVTGIASTLGEVYQHSLVPNQVQGNANCADVIASSDCLGFYFYKMSIKKEYAEIIDKYFDMFGYKVNIVKLPNVTGRTNWNYVKTINCNLEGDIPQLYVKKLEEMFNSGVTFWHNPTTFLDYSQSNTIVS